MQLAETTVVADKYEIIKPLGRGGMGVVYLARQASMDRDVALKFLECTLDAKEAIERFKREAKIMSSLKHRNLIASYELGTWNNSVYLAMEYVEGRSLESELRKNGALEPARAVDFGKQIAEALACAHANGVIHRDLKPSNVLITKGSAGEEVIKVIDFGLAKVTAAADGKTVAKLTKTGCAVGTVFYMSPEQCLGKTVDARSDVYGLGAVVYHCITGRPPFDAENAIVVMSRHLTENAEALASEKLPFGLDSIVYRCMAKAPEDRYQTADKVAEALDMVARGRGADVTVYMPQVVIRKELEEVEEEPAIKLTPKQWLVALGALAILLGLGLMAPFAIDATNQILNGPAVDQDFNKIVATYERGDLAQAANSLNLYILKTGMPTKQAVRKFAEQCKTTNDLIEVIEGVKARVQYFREPNPDLLLRWLDTVQIDLYLQQGRQYEAQSLLNKYKFHNAQLIALSADTAAIAIKPDEALKLYSKLQNAKEWQTRMQLGKARCLFDLKRSEEALQILDEMSEPEDADLKLSSDFLKYRGRRSGNPPFVRAKPMSGMTRYDYREALNAYLTGTYVSHSSKPYLGNFDLYE